ncbi:MAG: ferredoxin [Spirochaetales bacterium]|nr:ferredoxin [Spirochaetales bacterium]
MHLTINESTCIGCGLCEELIPELVEMGKFTARVKQPLISPALEQDVLNAIEDCPSNSLSSSPGDTE